MTIQQQFAERFAQCLREKAAQDRQKITAREVAKAIRVSEPTVSRWQSGDVMPRDEAINRLARYLGVDPGWLRYGDAKRPLKLGKSAGTVPRGQRKRGKASGE